MMIDRDRWAVLGAKNSTGIYVRAQHPDTMKWENADIVTLDAPSLLTWLRSREGDNCWAEDVVGILLGHGHLHPIPGGEE